MYLNALEPQAYATAAHQGAATKPAPAESAPALPVALMAVLNPPASACEAVEASMQALADGALTGPLRQLVGEHLATGGKRIRARLALIAARDLSLPYERATPWAAACELLHNASLIHDDIQDADRTRRGAPALWVRHGVSQAINAGDALLMLPYAALGQCPPSAVPALVECLARRAALTASGQSLELALGGMAPISWASYHALADGKSGQFFALPVEGACILAGLSTDDARAIADAAATLGVLYQVLDDLLDLRDELRQDPEGRDVAQGRITALTCLHLDLFPADAPALPGLCATPTTASAFLHLLSDPSRDTFTHLTRFAQAQAATLRADPALRLATTLRDTLLALSDLFERSILALTTALTTLGRTP